jgi:hypothetical protein
LDGGISTQSKQLAGPVDIKEPKDSVKDEFGPNNERAVLIKEDSKKKKRQRN